MLRCLQLAEKGLGHVAPNPMVGCVLVHNNSIISEGYHQVYGGPHAEPNAIRNVSDELLKECSLYVSLEPCSHHGKTPPCADLIISKGIKKVYVGNLDTNPLVAGKGIEKLRSAGIAVEYGILNDECRALNKRFFTFHEKKRPYVILKWAQTQDNFISRWPIPQQKEDNWITGTESKQLVHQWRAQEQAILIGYNTLIADNPLLTTRLAEGKNPIRLVISNQANLDQKLNIFNSEANTIVFNEERTSEQNHITYIKISATNKISEILNYCFTKGISSIIVEGGTKTIEEFMKLNMWDEARVFVNPHKTFVSGVKAPSIELNTTPDTVGEDLLYILKNNHL